MVERMAVGWVSATSPLLDGVPDISFSVAEHGDSFRWSDLRRRYVGLVEWMKSGSSNALQGIVEMGVHEGRLVGAVFVGQWGPHPISPDLGLAVAFHIPSAEIHRVELHGIKPKDRTLHVQLNNDDRLIFTFEMVVGQSRRWKAKLNDEVASEIVSAMCGLAAVRWLPVPGHPNIRIAG